MPSQLPHKTPVWRKILKITLWTLMAFVLVVAAAMICLVRVVDSDSLTRITARAANSLLDADVTIGRVQLDMKGHMPLLTLRVDSVTVISKPIQRLSSDSRSALPQWSDTLLRLTGFTGGLNVAALLRGKIDLYDVEFIEPAINLVSVNDSVANYLIYSSTSEEKPDTAAVAMPKISINRFSITRPRPLRFYSAVTQDGFEVRLNTLELDGSSEPTYALDLGGDMAMPSLAVYNLGNLRFAANGRLGWDPEKPTEVELENFSLLANFLKAQMSAHVDFGNEIVVKDYAVGLEETLIEDLLSFVPDSLRREYGLDKVHFSTDCAVGFSMRSTAPYNLTNDSLPSADVRVDITPGMVRYDKTEFRSVSGTLLAFLRGNDLNQSSFEARDFRVEGNAIDVKANLNVGEVMGDMCFSGDVNGKVALQKLPGSLKKLAKGFVAGRVTADLKFKGRMSMLSEKNFHKLDVVGDVDADDFYYLSADTVNMFDVPHACLKFGTKTKINADSLLTAHLRVDTANILHSEYSMKCRDFDLGLGVSNRNPSADTTLVVPMGGDLKLGKFYLTVLSDSIAFNIRNAHGRVTMQRYNNDAHRPLFGLDIDVAHISTGSPDMRFLLSKANITARAFKLDRPEIPKSVQKAADSLRTVYPDIPMDSVYARAIRQVRGKRGGGWPRIHPEYADSSEIIYWGTSRLVRDLLLGWDIHGSLTANRAGLYTPYFPVRNRVRDFNVTFCNDSVVMSNIRYKAGSSDFLLSGRISNMKRGFTSRGFRSPLKLNFELLSDTVDINELANTTFRGSAYAANREEREKHKFSVSGMEREEDADDLALEKELGKIVADAPDSLAPLLVPKNIEANVNVRARNILYSDLLFHDLTGELLASRGSLNLHNLQAKSDVGSVNLSALYSTPSADDIQFGFGMQVERFNMERFIKLVPAVDSIMPLLKDFSGIIDADIAATCDVDRGMNLVLPSLEAAIRISGDSLVLIDPDTYKTIGKWLMFKDKQSNVIKHMNVEMTVKDDVMQLYPFIFDLDRYKLGVQGYNDLNLNFDYHIAVLKSPLPFKFGINLKGNPDNYKIRLGKARLNERQVAQSVAIVDTTRVNLLSQLESVFRRGVSNSRFARLNIAGRPTAAAIDLNSDTISHADSLLFIKEGLIPAPPVPEPQEAVEKSKSKKGEKSKGKKEKKSKETAMILPKETIWARK